MARIHIRTLQKKKKNLKNPDNHSGVVTLLELNILECEVRGAIRSITTSKASGGDRISAQLVKVLNMMC